MSLIALTSAKGAPGVTTASLALAAVWPVRTLLAECDPSGSDLVWRLCTPDGAPLDRQRGVLSLASKTTDSDADPWQHIQPVAGGLDVLTGVPGWRQARALGQRWDPIAETLRSLDADVLADCGRIDADSVVLPVVAHAHVVACVVRATVDSLAHARRLIGDLATVTNRVVVLVVADVDDRHLVDEVRDALYAAALPVEVQVFGPLAFDPAGVRLLYGGSAAKLARTWTVRTARPIAAALAGLVAGAGLDEVMSR